MAGLDSIGSSVWGISTIGYGVIVEGVAAIRQRMDIAIRTTRGTDPLRPEFGSYVFRFVDAPVNVAVPNIKQQLIEALQMWVPEIQIVSINHSFAAFHNPVFEITYKIVDDNLIDKLIFDIRQGATITDAVNEIILQAFFPPNPNNYRYQVSLIKNGNQVFPLPNPAGYGTLPDLFAWIQANWFYLGRWYYLTDKIVCYMSSEGVTSATLAIQVLPVTRFEADFPPVYNSQTFDVLFSVNGASVEPAMPKTFSNPGEVLSYAQIYWSEFATWYVEYGQPNGDAIFSDEFSDEFAVASTGYKLVGVSNEEGFVPVLSIGIIE
ncbi:hypothetical protein LZZ85_11465 [Terrimonas sp. NA20]|uniref:Uncharacterized protein n=1 Tax=Terrimonas ginsenosidimutans TaxID=2908004 RepID=A0ABS9KRD8_9BACT|nr:GPW/gp25 family protein [Terrimonas ginsenosidimutans]MCG2614907.1 hypothetical protein [Terrimonas ginsenosidimutans]